jgi:hypothetical protein
VFLTLGESFVCLALFSSTKTITHNLLLLCRCVHLSKITTLTSLELCGGGIGDLGCAHLATLLKLTSLNLSQNESITNCGAASLAALTNLKALNLSNTGVNSDALKFFGGLLKLQSLALYGCQDIRDSPKLSSLQTELPSLRCLRLNSPTNEDGIIDHSEEEDDDDDDDDAHDDDDDDDDVGVDVDDDEEEGDADYIEAVDDDQMSDVSNRLLDDEGEDSMDSSEGGSEDFQDAFNEIQSVDSSHSWSRRMDSDT